MTAGVASGGDLWLVIVALGAGTFAMRLSFVQLYAWVDELPQPVERGLVLVPAAVLAALITPALFALDARGVEAVVNAHFLAGAAGAAVAWRTRSMTATIAVGMAVPWTVRYLVG